MLRRIFLLLLAAGASLALYAAETATPRLSAHAKHYMVAAAHPLAVDAGLRMLDLGGSAVDAAIATQLVLGLVEPHASGLGGGAFMLYYDAKRNAIRAYDARETAPGAVTPQLFLRDDGQPMAFNDAVVGGRSVGVPGLPRLLELAHARHGRLGWATLFAPAIRLAQKGFPLSPRLHALLAKDTNLARDAAARAYFYLPDGRAKPAGTILRNPEYANTLRALIKHGADGYYRGAIARDVVSAVRSHPDNPGVMTEADLASYRVREVETLCTMYRIWRVCGMPPSSSGGIAIAQILGILAHTGMEKVRPGSLEAIHRIAEAERLAFADRNRYVGDDRFVEVPLQGLIDPAYLAQRAALIRPGQSLRKAEPGTPSGVKIAYADDATDEVPGTSHISIVDKFGNAVSMTTTIEFLFGSHVMVHGFLLNNQLTDFNFLPQENGVRVANSVYSGKRPRSSMAPTLVFDGTGKLYMAVGSPGGSFIIGYVAKTLVATLDWNMDIQAAIDMPNFGSRNGPTEIEAGSQYENLIGPLKVIGHEVSAIDMTSGLQGIVRSADGWSGGADARREGAARGR